VFVEFCFELLPSFEIHLNQGRLLYDALLYVSCGMQRALGRLYRTKVRLL